ncbi:hypothetical protein F5887DRAFT_163239 [Amanita rubescens]|nr:hypothetical protein F5887DRAFT_163239 [Amanita rubescens]
MTREQLEVLQERIIRVESEHAGQLESVKEKLKAEIAIVQEQRAGLQECLNQARQDAVEQRTLLDERLSRQESASEKLLEAQQRRAEVAENAAAQAKLQAEAAKEELEDCLRREKESQTKVESVEQDLRNTQFKMQNAIEKAESAREQSELGEKERLALLDKISTMETQIVNLKEANHFLTTRSKTLRERYNNGDLSDQEKSFVHLISSITQSAHENAHLEQTNELKRREAMINTLQERIKTLESTVARLLRERGEIRPEMKSLVNLNLWMSSSPQEGLNPIPTVDPMQITCTSAPMTPHDETSLAGRTIAETKMINLIYSKPDSDNVKQSPTFSELSRLDSGDDDIPLAQLSRLSPSPPPPVVQGTNKRGRAASPAPTNSWRLNRE